MFRPNKLAIVNKIQLKKAHNSDPDSLLVALVCWVLEGL